MDFGGRWQNFRGAPDAGCRLTSASLQPISLRPIKMSPGRLVLPAPGAPAFYFDWSNSRETDLSTEQARAQAPPRFSRAHEHAWWRESSRAPPRQGPQAPVGIELFRIAFENAEGLLPRCPAPCSPAKIGFRPLGSPLEHLVSGWGQRKARPEPARREKRRGCRYAQEKS